MHGAVVGGTPLTAGRHEGVRRVGTPAHIPPAVWINRPGRGRGLLRRTAGTCAEFRRSHPRESKPCARFFLSEGLYVDQYQTVDEGVDSTFELTRLKSRLRALEEPAETIANQRKLGRVNAKVLSTATSMD